MMVMTNFPFTASPDLPWQIFLADFALADLPWQIKHVCPGLGRPQQNRNGPLQTAIVRSGQARRHETCQSFVACPIRAGLPQAGHISNPGRDEEHIMKILTLSALVVVTQWPPHPAALAQDAAAGKTSFNKCSGLSRDRRSAKTRSARSLTDFGRPQIRTARTIPIPSNKNSGITWNEAQFKNNQGPQAKIPGPRWRSPASRTRPRSTISGLPLRDERMDAAANDVSRFAARSICLPSSYADEGPELLISVCS